MCASRVLISLKMLLALAVGFAASASASGNNDLLAAHEMGDKEFTRVEIGNLIVYYHQRTVDDATVEGDYIIYQFDKNSKKLLKKRSHWRDGLPDHCAPQVTRERAESLVSGEVQSSRLYFIAPKSAVFPLDPPPQNPCWVVRSVDNGRLVVTIIDALEGGILGYGVPPPSGGFSFSGPACLEPCFGSWVDWYQNAAYWFEAMGYTTESLQRPAKKKVRTHVQSCSTAVFYEIAHGDSVSFISGCPIGEVGEYTSSADISRWISDYPKIPFTFIGSCEGMCNVDSGSLSFAFRKGSMRNTVTVGYCHMNRFECGEAWGYSVEWQDAMFHYLYKNLFVAPKYTVKEAFDRALADYPWCEGCVQFAGDEDFVLEPGVLRSHAPTLFDGRVTPETGTRNTLYTYSVRYHDADGDVPLVASVYIDGEPHEMSLRSSKDSLFSYQTTLSVGKHEYFFSFEDGCGACRLPESGVIIGPDVHLPFIRADADADGVIDLFDCLWIIRWLGGKPPAPPCIKAADVDDSGLTPDLYDALMIVYWLVEGGIPPATPCCISPGDCGVDPTPDPLPCTSYPPCDAMEEVLFKVTLIGRVEESKIMIGRGTVEDDMAIVPVTIVNAEPLVGFRWTIEYDADLWRATAVDNAGLVTESFDVFVSGVEQPGFVKAAGVSDMNMADGEEQLPKGEHQVARVVFERRGDLDGAVTLDLTEGVMAVSHDRALRHELVDGLITSTMALPSEFDLSQNHPNPFNSTTEIAYALPVDCWVMLEIYNIAGQKVASLVDGEQQAGKKAVAWDASSFSSGLYFYRLQAGDFVETRRMILLK